MRTLPRWIAPGLLACLAFASDALACTTALGVEPFQPDVARANRGLDLFHIPAPPAVHAEVAKVRRTAWGDCDLYAEIELTLSWAGHTSLPLDKVGIYVRPVGQDSPLLTNGDTAYMARMVDGRPTFTIWARDWPSGGLLDFDADLFVIDSGLRISPPTRFHVHSDERSTTHYEATLAGMTAVIADLVGMRNARIGLNAPNLEYKQATVLVTEGLMAQLASFEIPFSACGPYAPLCGQYTSALLARGKIVLPGYDGKPREEMLACVGVRQETGSIARVVLVNTWMQAKVAAADWVDPVDAFDWESAAPGCQALFDVVVAREAAYYAAHPSGDK